MWRGRSRSTTAIARPPTFASTTRPPKSEEAAMLLTRKSEGQAEPLNPLARAASAVGAKPVDRRTFLKGTGITAGAAAFASQLPLNMIGEAGAAPAKTGKTEVKRT